MATKVLPSQRQFKQFEEQVILGQLALPEVIWRGAQLMLQHAVELEMTEYLGREYYRNDAETPAARGAATGTAPARYGPGRGRWRSSCPRPATCRRGVPRFPSKILEAYVSRTESLETLITRMYVAGMSTRDIETAFVDLLSGHGVSRTHGVADHRAFERGPGAVSHRRPVWPRRAVLDFGPHRRQEGPAARGAGEPRELRQLEDVPAGDGAPGCRRSRRCFPVRFGSAVSGIGCRTSWARHPRRRTSY